ncbi:glucokinase (plasmid) [Agrobacterium salinitolerans]|uniref:glucokinase n=1 Tax=Agrobacterium salinitolerans TaxID=1183413 RepID=UPI001C2466C5|nr:glucokinase [Agrobacterium salinitolerans]QXC53049.1 glucokinase [Agrobacterium salinitolerans]
MLISDRHAIVGEVGAEHLRFAVSDVDELTIDHLANLRTEDFASFQEALSSYLKSLGPHCPRKASLVVAGYLAGDRVHISGSMRTFEKTALQSALNLDTLTIVSDAAAVVKAAPFFASHDLHLITGAPARSGPRLAIVLDSGMRSAITSCDSDAVGYRETWAGDMTFGAADEKDLWFVDQVCAAVGRRTAEAVLSTDGFLALCKLHSENPESSSTVTTVEEALLAAARHSGAAAGLQRYRLWLARFLRDAALATGAQGGIYLTGSLPVKLLAHLNDGNFSLAFMAQGPLAVQAPLYILDGMSVSLKGAAAVYQ